MAYSVKYSIKGEAATDTTVMTINIIGTETHSDALIAAGLMASLIDAMIDGVITGATITEHVDLPGTLKSSPVDGARTSAGMKFSFRTDGDNPTYVRVPSRKEDLIVDGAEVVDLTKTSVVNFLAAMTGGLTDDDLTGTTVFTDTRDEPIDRLVSATEDFKKN
jgi:hypothetical protein